MASAPKANAFAVPALLLAWTADAQLNCAPDGAVLCGSSEDVTTINSAKYARDLVEAGANTFILGIGGAEALQEVIGDVLSPGCLTCQGAMLDCSAKQVQCFQACAENTCGRACRRCVEEACPVQKACGGVPGETLQYPFTCANPSDSDSLAVDKSLLNVPFTGSCSHSASSDMPPAMSTHNDADAVTADAAADSINIPIRPRAEEAAGDTKADSINIPIRPRAEDASADSINIPIRPRAEEAAGDAKADAINIPVKPRAEEAAGDAENNGEEDGSAIVIPIKNQSAPEENAGNIFIPPQPKHPRAAWSGTGASADSIVSAQMTCAPAGQAYCGSRSDMNAIDNAHFAGSLAAAAAEVFINQIPGTQALEGVLGKSRLSDRCLACQGAALDCSVQQTQCYQFCAESSCSAECRSCMQQKCDTSKACGGTPGVSIQNPYTCINNDPNTFHVNRDLLNLPFTGQCSRRLEIDRTEVIV